MIGWEHEELSIQIKMWCISEWRARWFWTLILPSPFSLHSWIGWPNSTTLFSLSQRHNRTNQKIWTLNLCKRSLQVQHNSKLKENSYYGLHDEECLLARPREYLLPHHSRISCSTTSDLGGPINMQLDAVGQGAPRKSGVPLYGFNSKLSIGQDDVGAQNVNDPANTMFAMSPQMR